VSAQQQPTGPNFPNTGQAVSAGYALTQTEDGTGGFVAHFEKRLAGEDSKGRFANLRAVGTGKTAALAKQNALDNLNAQRALRYGAGTDDNSGSFDPEFTHVPDLT